MAQFGSRACSFKMQVARSAHLLFNFQRERFPAGMAEHLQGRATNQDLPVKTLTSAINSLGGLRHSLVSFSSSTVSHSGHLPTGQDTIIFKYINTLLQRRALAQGQYMCLAGRRYQVQFLGTILS